MQTLLVNRHSHLHGLSSCCCCFPVNTAKNHRMWSAKTKLKHCFVYGTNTYPHRLRSITHPNARKLFFFSRTHYFIVWSQKGHFLFICSRWLIRLVLENVFCNFFSRSAFLLKSGQPSFSKNKQKAMISGVKVKRVQQMCRLNQILRIWFLKKCNINLFKRSVRGQIGCATGLKS